MSYNISTENGDKMSNDRYSDEQLRDGFGMRGGGAGLFAPQELGYRCPVGHANLTWSEFNEHIWCYKCEKDYHYAEDCFLIEDECNPTSMPEQPRILKGMDNWDETGNVCVDVPMEIIRFINWKCDGDE